MRLNFNIKTSVYAPKTLKEPVPGHYAVVLCSIYSEDTDTLLRPGEAFMFLGVEGSQYPSINKKIVLLHDTKKIRVPEVYFPQLLFVPISPVLSEKNICITGTLRWDRAVYERLIKLTFGEFKTGVSKNTDYLLIGENPGNTKLNKAKNCGTTILSEDEFFEKFFSSTSAPTKQ